MRSSTLLSTKPHYEILDGLRGVAAFVVLAYHLAEANGIVLGHGYLGVDFFYALSGFVIGYAYDSRRQSLSVGGFFKRRIIRLHPMVIMGTLVGLVFYYFSAGDAFPLVGQSPWWKVLLLFGWCCLMLPMPISWDIRGWADFNSFNGNIWSLYWEYLANILYVLVFRHLPTMILALLTLFAAVGTLDLTFNLNLTGLMTGKMGAPFTVNGGWALSTPELYVGAVRLPFPFLMGLLLSRLTRFRIGLRGAFGWTSLAVIALLLMPQLQGIANGAYEASVILLILPIILMVGAGNSIAAGPSKQWCKFLGDISYPLYITHLPFIYMLIDWNSEHPQADLSTKWLLAILVGLFSVAVAYACLKLYDEPVRKWLTARFR